MPAFSPAFLTIVAMAYAMAISNILAGALKDYLDRLGTAGAILGRLYHMLPGLGLVTPRAGLQEVALLNRWVTSVTLA